MKITLLSVLVIMLFCGGCSIFRVERSVPDGGIGLSGSFNPKDSPEVARGISLEITSDPWLESFREARKRSPVLMIGTLTNESYQPIDMKLFTSQLMHEILNAGQIPFVEEIQVPIQDPKEPSLELARELKADFYALKERIEQTVLAERNAVLATAIASVASGVRCIEGP